MCFKLQSLQESMTYKLHFLDGKASYLETAIWLGF